LGTHRRSRWRGSWSDGVVGDDRDGCRSSVMMIVQQLEEGGAMELGKWELKKKV
jgi:hypothetical protein